MRDFLLLNCQQFLGEMSGLAYMRLISVRLLRLLLDKKDFDRMADNSIFRAGINSDTSFNGSNGQNTTVGGDMDRGRTARTAGTGLENVRSDEREGGRPL